MGKKDKPRSGSMGVWPRKRAVRPYARVRAVPANSKEAKPLAFPGYKAGMTHAIVTGSQKGRTTEKIDAAVPVTIIECPPIRIASLRLYKKDSSSQNISTQLNFKTEKELSRKLSVSKKPTATKADLEKLNPDDYSDATIQIYTQPKLTSIKKTPEIFEIKLGGTVAEKIAFATEHFDKQIKVQDVFKEGQFVDAHAITTGRGFQGPVKRFGIGLRQHKSEKSIRNPGSLGGWKGQAHVMYRVAHAGQTGYHQRTQINNFVLKISDNPQEVKIKGGIINFGEVKSTYLLLEGSVPGPKKRLITLTQPMKQLKKKSDFKPDGVKQIITASHQGR